MCFTQKNKQRGGKQTARREGEFKRDRELVDIGVTDGIMDTPRKEDRKRFRAEAGVSFKLQWKKEEVHKLFTVFHKPFCKSQLNSQVCLLLAGIKSTLQVNTTVIAHWSEILICC